MKRKICIRSMVLGGGIMLIGLVVGAIVSPPLIAQRNGVFDEITCRSLEVIDKRGNRAVFLSTDEDYDSNAVVLYDRAGNQIIYLGSSKKGKGIVVFDESGTPAVEVTASGFRNRRGVAVIDKAGNEVIGLVASAEGGNGVFLSDKSKNPRFRLVSLEQGTVMQILDKSGNTVIGLEESDEQGGRMGVLDKAGTPKWLAP